MNIIFICGSLEPGKDGIGDYIRRFAGELVRQGHQASAVALNDHHITTTYFGIQLNEDIHLNVLRIPSAFPPQRRMKIAREWIDKLNPEWLSLQFVPFTYHSKGIPIRLSSQLLMLGKGRSWDIMFHELWVGIGTTSSPKEILWGWIQRRIIRRLIQRLNPKTIHTQALLYQILLTKLGFNAKLLPLFTNIPAVNHSRRKSIECIDTSPKETITLITFGSIHGGAPITELAKEAVHYSTKYRVRVLLKMVGRCGKEQQFWFDVWKAAGLDVELLGEQPPEHISKMLSSASLGIATTSTAVIEKSGSVAAMLQHGLRVLCVARPWKPRGVSNLNLPPGVTEYIKGNLEACINTQYHFTFNNDLAVICRQFESDIHAKQIIVTDPYIKNIE